jgi:hypothetical protein
LKRIKNDFYLIIICVLSIVVGTFAVNKQRLAFGANLPFSIVERGRMTELDYQTLKSETFSRKTHFTPTNAQSGVITKWWSYENGASEKYAGTFVYCPNSVSNVIPSVCATFESYNSNGDHVLENATYSPTESGTLLVLQMTGTR